jgi:hypothetical protein
VTIARFGHGGAGVGVDRRMEQRLLAVEVGVDGSL